MSKISQQPWSDEDLSPKTGEQLIAQLGSKSAAIRHLTSKGWSRSQIATHLNIRYQHVRNVQLAPVKKS